jgi:molecular chaperone DnaJ
VTRELQVDIPPGIHDGQQIRVRGEGHAGFRSSERGNAFVVVRVRPDPRFVRDGDDLHTAVRLTMTDAALGTTAKVASLSGDLEVEIPSGTQPGEVLVLRGEGMPALRGSRRGALHVRLDVAVPTTLDPEQRRLLEDVDRTLGPEAYRQKSDEGFLGRLKSALR